MVLVGARLFHFAAAMLSVGAALFPLYAGVRPTFPMRIMAAAALLSGAIWFGCVLVNVTGSTSSAFSVNEVALVLGQTSFGRAWLVHLLFGVALVVAAMTGRTGIVAGLAILNLASLAWIGHAAVGDGAEHSAHLANHIAHLLAGGVWLGGLVPLWKALSSSDASARPQIVGRFTRTGYIAVSVVLLTGLANTWFVTGTLLPSTSSEYGGLLWLKIGLVGLLLTAAVFNQFVAARRKQWPLLDWGIGAELVLFACVLAVVSLLGVSQPPSGP